MSEVGIGLADVARRWWMIGSVCTHEIHSVIIIVIIIVVTASDFGLDSLGLL